MEFFFYPNNTLLKDHLEDASINGTIILRSIFRKLDVGAWTESIWLTIGTSGGYLRIR